MAGRDQAFGRGGFRRVQTDGACAGQVVVVRQPELGACRVRQILLVQHLQCGFGLCQLCQHGIGAGAWQTSIQQFDHHVGILDPFSDRFTGQVHVTGEPLDGHVQDTFGFG